MEREKKRVQAVSIKEVYNTKYTVPVLLSKNMQRLTPDQPKEGPGTLL